MAVPGLRLDRVARGPHSSSEQKSGIERCPHPYRRLPIAGVGGALIKEPRGNDVTGVKEGIAARQELGDLRCGETRGSRIGRLGSR